MKHSYKCSVRAFTALFAFVFTMSSVAQIEEIVVTARKKAENLTRHSSPSRCHRLGKT